MIGIIDLGSSNLGSIQNLLKSLKVKYKLIKKNRTTNFSDFDKIILPGVGSFKSAMDKLKKNDLINFLNLAYKKNIPILGICLGMQLMCKHSTEGGNTKGLGWFNIEINRFNQKKVKKIPIIGWNNVLQAKKDKIFNNINSNSEFYFIHSYYLPLSKIYTIGFTNINFNYSSVIKKKNIYGCQFHPEKSQKNGIQLIENFINM